MTEFKSWQAYRTFKWHVRHRTRYIFDDEVREFLDAVVSTSENRKRPVPAGSVFWRAQRGHGWATVHQDSEEFEVPGPFKSERMKQLHNMGARLLAHGSEFHALKQMLAESADHYDDITRK